MSKSISFAEQWFKAQAWNVFPFQRQTWQAYLDGYSGILNAPTGSGKTYALLVPILLEYIDQKGKDAGQTPIGIQAIWVCPIRALAKEIRQSARSIIEGFGLSWTVGIRTGDTGQTERKNQFKTPPNILITTPESIHVMMCLEGYERMFSRLRSIIADEWHELMGSKRGVQMELALSRMKAIRPNIKIWGISATIGNMEESMDVLLGVEREQNRMLIKADIKKEIIVESVIPERMDNFPWAGHLGLHLIEQLIDIIEQSKTALIFTNTRGQCELWYQKLLEKAPHFAGQIAMHHGSISRDLRDWVEEAIHEERLKAVVCTSSLDLGVDFRPVQTVVQIGSPKGVAKFMQRAGRSGHQPGAVSKIYFLPTHALELLEAAALRKAIEQHIVEDRIPYVRSFDVLIQYLMTLGVSGGFDERKIFKEVKSCFSFESMSAEEWSEILGFLVYGGKTLDAYDEYKKMVFEQGLFLVRDKRIAQKHKLSIGTIVGGSTLFICFMSGKKIGTIEEWFISLLNPGDVFWFAGKALEFVRIKEMTAYVRKSNKKNGKTPSWLGGRMSFSANLSQALREKYQEMHDGEAEEKELKALKELFKLQKSRSLVPDKDEFLIEYIRSKEGFHLLMYPYEGRFVHEGLGALLAQRIAAVVPISFTIAMNDYGFELLSDREIDLENILTKELFSPAHLFRDIQSSLNAVEMARRRFRDIAKISGLLFQGYPGKAKKERHLQSSAELFFDVFRQYDKDNLLYLQTYDEVMNFQLEESRMRKALERIQRQKIMIIRSDQATPFSFPIMVDRMREKLSSEKLLDRIEKMKVQL